MNKVHAGLEENKAMSEPLTRKQVEHTLQLIIDHSLRAWKSSDEVQMILDHDAALRTQHEADQARITELTLWLEDIRAYAQPNGCCPYGCDTPEIARRALTGESHDTTRTTPRPQ